MTQYGISGPSHILTLGEPVDEDEAAIYLKREGDGAVHREGNFSRV
jgi:hypothetical protein